jgi:rubrerythrin
MARSYKVGRILEDYDVGPYQDASREELEDLLIEMWTEEGQSLHEITDWLNQEIMRQIYLEHARSISTERIEYEYETLTGENDVARDDLVETLQEDGIDVEALTDQMVSLSSVYNYLTDFLGAESDRNSTRESRISTAISEVDFARSNLRRRSEKAAETLAEEGAVAGAADAEVSVSIQLKCPECGVAVDFDIANERGFVCVDHSQQENEDDTDADSSTMSDGGERFAVTHESDS